MIRYLFAAAVAAFLFAAQPTQAQFSLGPRVGLNAATFRVSPDPIGENPRRLPGYQVGAAAQWRLGAVAIQPAVLYTQQGARHHAQQHVLLKSGELAPYRTRNTTRLNYLELPLHVAYAPAWARHAQVFAGPYFGMGVGGYLEAEPEVSEVQGIPVSPSREKAQFPRLLGSREDARLFDWGLQAGVGYQRGPVLVQLQQSGGTRDVWPDYYQGRNGRRYHRVTSFTLTYLFGSKSAD
ncbi:outer membrane beta-barrel protein [Hymenobacter busanensis]|nr:outer membrane beta-barrel protein [Hymenobacter busanensis]QHJ09096.1 outer membrane beta-barrel protein [Hymenobacter busanensis]